MPKTSKAVKNINEKINVSNVFNILDDDIDDNELVNNTKEIIEEKPIKIQETNNITKIKTKYIR